MSANILNAIFFGFFAIGVAVTCFFLVLMILDEFKKEKKTK